MHSPRLIALLLALGNGTAFADDTLAPPGDAPPVNKPEPKHRPTGEFFAGVGYNPDDGFIATMGLRQPRLFGTHQGLSMSADISQLQQRVGIVYEVPDLLGTGLDLKTELFSHRIAYPTFVREAAGGEATLSHRIDKATRVFGRYRVEAVTISEAENGASASPELPRQILPPRNGTDLYTWLGAGLEYDTRDNPIPTKGTHLELLAETSDPELGSSAKLTRLSGRLVHATPLGPFTLRLGGRATYLRGPAGVPFAQRLQYGGHGEVPGYGIGSQGDGGADFAASGRAELELPVIPKLGLSVAGFLAGGVRYNADPTWGPVGATTLRSAGASIIWRSPLGPLRFDWVKPLDGSQRDHVFLFTLGAGF